jgi:hypothetical protein
MPAILARPDFDAWRSDDAPADLLRPPPVDILR